MRAQQCNLLPETMDLLLIELVLSRSFIEELFFFPSSELTKLTSRLLYLDCLHVFTTFAKVNVFPIFTHYFVVLFARV